MYVYIYTKFQSPCMYIRIISYYIISLHNAFYSDKCQSRKYAHVSIRFPENPLTARAAAIDARVVVFIVIIIIFIPTT